MFDPEKVRNYTLSGIQHEPVNQHYVKASDYDRLLVLYREAIKPRGLAPREQMVANNLRAYGNRRGPDSSQCSICGDIMHQTHQHSMYQP